MKDDGTIWISGTYHNIFSIGQILQELNFKILNVITWEKNNPPPNFSCRFFTHSAELIIWARKKEKVPHYYNYELMKKLNGDKQMKDVSETGHWGNGHYEVIINDTENLEYIMSLVKQAIA
jgi:site-specific DNA-methyltransferase (adenine-specific)